jgi:O-antigen ligase
MWYLPILFTIPAFAIYFHSLAPNKNIFKGQDWGIWAAFLLTLVAALSWLFHKRSTRLTPLARAAVVLMLIAWMYQVVRTQFDGATFNLTAFLVPLSVMLILLKPPRLSEIRLAGLALAYSLILVSALSLAFGALGIGPDGFALPGSGGTRLRIFGNLTGIDIRWGGPFGSVNLASSAGGLVAVLAFSYRGMNRYLILSGGLVILLLTQARTPAIALVAALAIVAMWSPSVARFKYRIPLRISALVVFVSGYAGYVFTSDPTFNGRAVIWSDFGALWLESPLLGVGNSGIIDFVNSRINDPLFVPHQHAHSVLGDVLIRYGVPMLVLSLGVFITSMAISIRSASRDSGKNMAIVTFVILAGLTETIHSFNYFSVYLCALLFVVLSCSNILSTAAGKTHKRNPLLTEVE